MKREESKEKPIEKGGKGSSTVGSQLVSKKEGLEHGAGAKERNLQKKGGDGP